MATWITSHSFVPSARQEMLPALAIDHRCQLLRKDTLPAVVDRTGDLLNYQRLRQ